MKTVVRLVLMISILATASSASAAGSAQALLVPAYGNPFDPAGAQMWTTLTLAAGNSGVAVHVIINPASGPGDAGGIDPNYIGFDGSGPALSFKQAGGRLYGYVATGYARRSLESVRAEVDIYFDPVYWRGAGVLIDGIFFDEMSNDLALVGYYQALRDHVASRSATARTIGNPGTPFTFDSSNGASGHDVDDYAAVFDTLMTFESDVTEYLNAYVAPTWAERVDASRFAHVVHSVTSDADSKQALTLSKQRKAGFVYLTHDVMPNPYDELSSRFADERARLLAANQAPPGQAVPIPGLALLAGLLGLLGGLLARARGARPGHGP